MRPSQGFISGVTESVMVTQLFLVYFRVLKRQSDFCLFFSRLWYVKALVILETGQSIIFFLKI